MCSGDLVRELVGDLVGDLVEVEVVVEVDSTRMRMHARARTHTRKNARTYTRTHALIHICSGVLLFTFFHSAAGLYIGIVWRNINCQSPEAWRLLGGWCG